ncbi:histidine-rich glycoprotein-like [Anopheles darlingi]|uniref:histidine-rich glycoprotein-like n=1 Tax=Anopheles darlingi TaxID=43151 RepID=UPI0021003188|nr:histidine-rich glycoprotein-like [Anopheles darlingi]
MIKIALIFSVAIAVALAYEHEDYHSHPSYKFEYGVKDPHTGDHKSQWEHRDGDVVKGQYTLEEADGTHRVVEYSSDKHNGFQAHVKRVGHAHHPEVYGHHEGGHSYGGHGYGKGSSYANGNLYQHHHFNRQPHFNPHRSVPRTKEPPRPKMMKIAFAVVALLAVAAQAYEHEDYHSHPSYKFEYGVKDPHTGDHKSQWEHRDGDVVKGQYTLEEADGTHRVVEYSSDKHNGFQAHVKRVGHAHHLEVYGHHEGGHSYGGHGHGKGSSYANGNLYQHHH